MISDGIKEVLTELGYSLQDCGKEFRTRPLYRESDNNNILVIKKENGLWYDFKLSKGGTFEELVRLTLKLDNIEDTKEIIKSRVFSESKEYVRDKPNLKKLKTFPMELLSELNPDHSYWEGRGVNKETVKIFKGGVASSGKMADRYVFPVFNNSDKIIGFSGRCVLTNSQNTYRPTWKHIGAKSEWVYPEKNNYELIKNSKKVILVESIGDMLSLWQAGIKNVLVTFGLRINSGIMGLFLRIEPVKIILSFNKDPKSSLAGQKAADKAFEKLSRYFSEKTIQISFPYKNDFGEMTTNEIIKWGKENNV